MSGTTVGIGPDLIKNVSGTDYYSMPLFAYVAMGATWLSTILPSAGIGMQNNFLSQLADFNYLNIGGMSFWTPHVILISAGIELFVFTFLAIHSYCRHQVA